LLKFSLGKSGFPSINKQTVAKLDEFLDKEVRARVKDLEVHELRAWYRGLGNSGYKLLPTLHRTFPPDKISLETIRQREKNLFARFQTQAGELMPRGLESSWEILSVMQHYGVPTRVMDWTSSLFVALYFALEYEDPSPSPCIWVLNPFRLNKEALRIPDAKKAVIFDQVDRLPDNAYKVFIEEKHAIEDKAWEERWGRWPPKLPVATAPIWGHVRALRQRGYFTIHGNDDRPLEQQSEQLEKQEGKPLVYQIKIEKKFEEPLRQLLGEAGVDYYSLFPDLGGLARTLRKRYD
jgi:FRG domain